MAPRFPEPQWFLALGRLMADRGVLFQRIGYVEARFVVRVLADENSAGPEQKMEQDTEQNTGVAMEGYALTAASALAPGETPSFDPDFIICARRAVWLRMLDEIAHNGHPDLRHTLNSLALMGDELWLESTDQLREDKFYRFNQSLQELFNLAARLPAD
jgi:hypothetical protein